MVKVFRLAQSIRRFIFLIMSVVALILVIIAIKIILQYTGLWMSDDAGAPGC